MPNPRPDSEMDAKVATEVMGWRVHNRNTAWWVDVERETGLIPSGGVRGLTCGTDRFSPSTNIVHAWMVVEKFTDVLIEKSGENWTVSINAWAEASAPTAPMAICLAALACFPPPARANR